MNPPTDGGGFRDFYRTGRILFYNSWKETFGKLRMYCSEFQQWLIHLDTHHGEYPYSLVPNPQIFRKCEASTIPEWLEMVVLRSSSGSDRGNMTPLQSPKASVRRPDNSEPSLRAHPISCGTKPVGYLNHRGWTMTAIRTWEENSGIWKKWHFNCFLKHL